MQLYFPVYLNLADRLCLVVGGGSVGERRTRSLLDASVRVRVVSIQVTLELEQMGNSGQIELLREPFRQDHIDGVALVFACTNSREVNHQITILAQSRGILVNVADSPDEGGFIVPNVVRRGELCISIATGGNNPTLSSRIGREIEQRFGPEYETYVELLGQMRQVIRQKTEDLPLRRLMHAALLDAEEQILPLLREERSAEAEQLANHLIEECFQLKRR